MHKPIRAVFVKHYKCTGGAKKQKKQGQSERLQIIIFSNKKTLTQLINNKRSYFKNIILKILENRLELI